MLANQKDKILVQKYGGSSVASTEQLAYVAKRIVEAREKGYQVVVVVSAMGNSTNQLFEMAREVCSDPPRRELDMLLSAGERISMALLSMAIQNLGHEAISMTGSQSGILTNDRHFDARIIEIRPIRIQDELAKDKVVIVAGFQGMSYKREITTLGRGGSDTTAVALAAALDAEACEIYSDVDGVYQADPRVICDAERLESISHSEMEELARCGAKVLHAEALSFAKKRKIALYARATSGGAGYTLIRKDLPDKSSLAESFAVACMEPVIVLRWKFLSENKEWMEEWLEKHHLSAAFAHWGDKEAFVCLQKDEHPQLESALLELKDVKGLFLKEECAVVSAVGSILIRSMKCFNELNRELEQKLGKALMVYNAPTRWSFVFPREFAKMAQQIVYDTLQSFTDKD